MKRNLPLAWLLPVLLLVAAQCGTVQQNPARPAESTATAAPPAAAPATSAPDPSAEAAANTDPTLTPTATAEAKPTPNLSDVRFDPTLWTAERISRYAGADVVDPASGLATDFSRHSIDYSEVLSGGPPPDGIPPIDNPTFESIEAGDEWLADAQPVIALELNDEARAYPLAILTWHEIANDEVGGVPVAVTFCPLCNAAIVFNREVNGQVLRFGVSGNLRNSDLIMWDNKTLSWWQQFTGEAIVGELTGTRLEFIPSQLVSWGDFKAAYPDGMVMTRSGSRNYGTNPYAGYDSTTSPFLFLGTPDSRLPATERVLGYFKGDVAKAYPLPEIAAESVIEDTVGGQDVVIFFEPGQVSALDNAVIEQSREVGSASMYLPQVNERQLTFTYQAGKIIDNETGSEWNVFGQAVAGELAGARLEPVIAHPHFWFAWAAFRPDTEIYGR